MMKKNKNKPIELDGTTWLKYSISIWDDIEKSKEENKLSHPAMFPSELVKRLILAYTRKGEWVLDPFLGIGSTLIACKETGRNGIGIEISEEYCKIAEKRLKNFKVPTVMTLDLSNFKKENENQEKPKSQIKTKQIIYCDDANNLLQYSQPNTIDLCVTSPPYWDILLQKRTADGREIRTYNGTNEKDISNIHDYDIFLDVLQEIFKKVYMVLKPNKRCCVVVMDIRKKEKFYPYHMDLTDRMEEIGFELDDIIIWDRRKEYNNLRPLGYPNVFRINKIHEYIMIYQKKVKNDI